MYIPPSSTDVLGCLACVGVLLYVTLWSLKCIFVSLRRDTANESHSLEASKVSQKFCRKRRVQNTFKRANPSELYS